MRLAAAVMFILAMPAAAGAEDIYAGVGPGTYCGWNRSGLPAAQQAICADFDRRFPPKKPNWRTVRASNGARYQVDANSIKTYSDGGAEIVAYIVEDGLQYRPGNQRRLWFDCKGRFKDLANVTAESAYAPPQSVIGQISAIACSRSAPAIR